MEVDSEATPAEIANNATKRNAIEDESPTPQTQEVPKKVKSEKSKRDDKNVEQFIKSLNSLPTAEEKLAMASKKYIQVADDNKKLQFYIKQSDKRYALLLKEKEQLQHEYNKTVLVKSKLENLCRELQKQNKSIKDESLTKIREEEERRKETQAKFQNTLSEITTLLQQNNDKNAKLRDDNIVITEKFKSVMQQYQLREQQVDKMAKQMNLEQQLSDAKMQKASLEHQAEKERLMSEMAQLKLTLAQYSAKIEELYTSEGSLKSQLAVYTDKYDEFQNALVKSNQVFGRSKEQIEKMSKKILKLEKESLTWKRRWESSQSTLLEMCSERQSSGRRLLSLQGLCRTLQAERTALLNTLKEHNIERPPLQPPPPPQADDKAEAMAANCATLKESIAQLQNQINVFTNKKEEEPKTGKQKKSKAKKNKFQKEMEEPVEASNAEEASSSQENNIEEASGPEENNVEDASGSQESKVEVVNVSNENNLEEANGSEESKIEKANTSQDKNIGEASGSQENNIGEASGSQESKIGEASSSETSKSEKNNKVSNNKSGAQKEFGANLSNETITKLIEAINNSNMVGDVDYGTCKNREANRLRELAEKERQNEATGSSANSQEISQILDAVKESEKSNSTNVNSENCDSTTELKDVTIEELDKK